MAEKEERISVIVYEKDPCENCPGNPMTDCQVCEKDLRYDGGITRQEAIERIAKAICAGDCENCSDGPMGGPDCIRWLEDCGKIAKAEAALNALLEGK